MEEEEEEEGAQAQEVGERKLNVNPKQTAKTQAPFTSSQWALMETMLAGLTFVESASRRGRRSVQSRLSQAGRVRWLCTSSRQHQEAASSGGGWW